MNVADLSKAIAVPRTESLDGNREIPLHNGLPLPESAIKAESQSRRRINRGMDQKAPPAFIDGHSHHPTPAKTQHYGQQHKGCTDNLCHKANDNGLNNKGWSGNQMIQSRTDDEPAHAEDIKQQHKDAHAPQRSSRKEIARREKQRE